MTAVPIVCNDPILLPAAQTLAVRLQSQVVESTDLRALGDCGFVLCLDTTGLALQQLGKKAPGPTRVDFVSGSVAHRRKFGGGKGQMIAKAVGLKVGCGLRVLDATAGLGKDAFVLATLGCQLQLLERTPIVAELLLDGLVRAQACVEDSELQDIVGRMQLQANDSFDYLTELSRQVDPSVDVVYLDPMFPERIKSAQIKKDMLAFHSVVGRDEDADALLPLARQVARYRVVVKRPRKAPPLNGEQPSHQLEGKSSRYDIYVNRKMSD